MDGDGVPLLYFAAERRTIPTGVGTLFSSLDLAP